MAADQSLEGIPAFVAVARARSFSKAAVELGLTKSAVGKRIARLEARLGLKLIHRTTRVTSLTPDGEAYLAACGAALEEIAAVEAALTSAHKVISGQLRLNMPVAFGRRVLLPILLEISAPHPGLSLSLTFTDTTIDPLGGGADLMIRFGALPDSSHLVARHLGLQDRVICASPNYLRRHGRPRSLADLKAHRAIVGSREGPPSAWVVRDNGVEKRITPPPAHEMSDGEAMVDAALAGFGMVQMPASLVRSHIEEGRLVRVLEDVSPAPVEVHALWPLQAQLSPKVRYVVDQLVAHAAKGRLD